MDRVEDGDTIPVTNHNSHPDRRAQPRIMPRLHVACKRYSLTMKIDSYLPQRVESAPNLIDKQRKRLLQSQQIIALIGLLLFAFACNLPLGYVRATARKFSVRWFVLIHISIPFIIVLRRLLGFNWHWIPLTLGCAVAGQILGAKMRRRALDKA